MILGNSSQPGVDCYEVRLQDQNSQTCLTIECRNGELGGKCRIYDRGRLKESGLVASGNRVRIWREMNDEGNPCESLWVNEQIQ